MSCDRNLSSCSVYPGMCKFQLSQWRACNLIRVIGHQIVHVSVHIHPLLQVKGYWPFMLLARQMHLYHLCQKICHTQDEIKLHLDHQAMLHNSMHSALA